MSIQKIIRKKGVVYRAITRVHRHRITKCFYRKIDAEQWILSQRSGNKISAAGNSLTVDQLRARFESEYGVLRQAPATMKLEGRIYHRYVSPYLGRKPVTELTALDIEQLINLLSHLPKISNGRINRVRTLLNGLFNRAIAWRLIGSNPVSETDPLPTDAQPLEKAICFLTQEEARRLLDWLAQKDPWAYPKVLVLLNCGLRYGEMSALRVQDMATTTSGAILRVSRTFCRHTFEVRNRTKGKRSRVIPIGASMTKMLSDVSKGKRGDMPLLWTDWDEVKNLWKFTRHFRRALKGANVTRIRVHDLRHTFAVHFLEGGGHLYDLQNLLGHSTSKLTERYSHFSQAMLARSCGIVDHHGTGKPQLAVINGGLRSEMSHKCHTETENEDSAPNPQSANLLN